MVGGLELIAAPNPFLAAASRGRLAVRTGARSVLEFAARRIPHKASARRFRRRHSLVGMLKRRERRAPTDWVRGYGSGT